MHVARDSLWRQMQSRGRMMPPTTFEDKQELEERETQTHPQPGGCRRRVTSSEMEDPSRRGCASVYSCESCGEITLSLLVYVSLREE